MFKTETTTNYVPCPFTLDKWDLLLIRYFKSNEPLTISGMKIIWAQRCSVSPDKVKTSDIVHRLARIVEELRLKPLELLIADAAPDSQWKYKCRGNDRDVKVNNSHYDCWARTLASCLMLTEVSKLPGWED